MLLVRYADVVRVGIHINAIGERKVTPRAALMISFFHTRSKANKEKENPKFKPLVLRLKCA